jgi:hypothetical protein
MLMTRILEYLDPKGRSPYAKWFVGLNAEAAAKVGFHPCARALTSIQTSAAAA